MEEFVKVVDVLFYERGLIWIDWVLDLVVIDIFLEVRVGVFKFVLLIIDGI